MSVKEAVQIARNNNFMGLMCSWRLLVSQSSPQSGSSEDTLPTGFPLLHGEPDGVDGTLRQNAILHFNDSVDM